MSFEREDEPQDPTHELERIETPEELLSFMQDRVHYGFIGRHTKKIYSGKNSETDVDFEREYFLQSPQELLASQYGNCWDSAELERQWFTEHGYQPQVYFLMYAKEEGTHLPTHTFVVYEKENKWFWFEHAFHDQHGIHEYASLDDLLIDVKNKHHAYAAKHQGANDKDFDRLRLAAFEKPNYGASAQDFVNDIVKQHPELIGE